MNLLEELLGAKDEFLQDEWDRGLIHLWRTYPSLKMYRVATHFMAKYRLNADQMFSLKRTPKPWEQKITVSRFIAAYLPRLNAHLWNNNKTEEELFSICKKEIKLHRPADDRQYIEEHTELARSKKDYRLSQIEYAESGRLWENQKLSNWGVVKGKTRRKL